MSLSKSEELFFRDAINSGAPKPWITSIIWMSRKLNIEPKYIELEALSHELDNLLLEGKRLDRRSGGS